MPVTTAKNSNEGRSVVITILSLIFLGILCSVVSRLSSPLTGHDISRAEVNVGFGDSRDSITASAIIKVEVPLEEAEEMKKTEGTEKTEKTEDSGSDRGMLSLESSKLSSAPPTTCCREQEGDWKMIVEFICQFREDVWNVSVMISLQIRDLLNGFLELLRGILCDILDTLQELTNNLIQMVDCNLTNEPSSGCSSSLLKDVLVWLEVQDEIYLQWIPPTIPTTGLNMIQKLLISFATVLCFFITIVLCIFFENSPEKDKIIKKLQSMFGDEPSETDESSNGASSSDSSSSSKSGSIRLVKQEGFGTVSKLEKRKQRRPVKKQKEKKRKSANSVTNTRKAIKKPEKLVETEKDDFVKIEVGIDKTG